MFKNKALIVAAAVIILALLGGAAYLKLSKSSTNQKGTEKAATPTTSANATNNTTLAGLLALGQNLRCSFNFNGTGGTSTQGTFYLSNGNLRGDFVVKNTDGKETQMNMIRNGDENYIWGPSLPTGIKMKLSFDKLATNEQANQFASLNQKTNYTCVPWGADSSMFNPPSNVSFTDVTSMMPAASPTGAKTQTASPCDQIADATTKAACIKALSGNK